MCLIGKDDTVQEVEVNMSGTEMARFVRFPGVVDHGMYDIRKGRQPGRPYSRFHMGDGSINRKKGVRANREWGVGSSNSTNEGG